MTVDESTTLRSQPIVRQFTAEHDQLLHAVVTQLERVTARLEALEARETVDVTEAGSANASSTATPPWRTKNGRQTGWQPARR